MIKNADQSGGNHKLSLYNAIMMMTIVRLYYYAANGISPYCYITISLYDFMRICIYADKTIKQQNTSLIDLRPGLLGP